MNVCVQEQFALDLLRAQKKDLKEEEEEKPIVCKFLLIFPGFDVCLCESSNNNLSCYSHFN